MSVILNISLSSNGNKCWPRFNFSLNGTLFTIGRFLDTNSSHWIPISCLVVCSAVGISTSLWKDSSKGRILGSRNLWKGSELSFWHCSPVTDETCSRQSCSIF